METIVQARGLTKTYTRADGTPSRIADLAPTLLDLFGTRQLGQAPSFGSAEVAAYAEWMATTSPCSKIRRCSSVIRWSSASPTAPSRAA